MIWRSWHDEATAAIRAELCAGGRPMQKYLDLAYEKWATNEQAGAMTTAILLNIEDRLVAIERATGIVPT